MCALCGKPLHDPIGYDAAGDPGSVTLGAAPTFSVTQVAQQLQRQWGGFAEANGWTFTWDGPNISYSMPNATPTNLPGYTPPEGGTHIVTMTATMIATARLAFELWDDLIAVSLTESPGNPSANITFDYSNSTSGGGTYARFWYYRSTPGADKELAVSQIWLNSTWSSHNEDSDLYYGGYGLVTYVHEIGHALGLSHPGTYNAGSGASITYANSAEFAQDNRRFTVMSYFGGYDPFSQAWAQDGTSSNWHYPETPMLYDIAAIQAKYGADTTTRLGDTVYGFNSTADRAVFDFAQNALPIFTIWDAGGNDTLDCSLYSGSQTIDLTAGNYSSVRGLVSNIAIAFNCTIENAIGGSGNDVLIANDSGCTLTGGGGNDSLIGGAGSDIIVFSGLRSDYDIGYDGATQTFTVADRRSGAPDGTDTARAVESFRFSDALLTFDSAGRLVGQDIRNADGTRTDSRFDAADAALWTSMVSQFDVLDRLTSQTVDQDNGSSWINLFDATGAAGWSWVSTAYDPAGNARLQTGTNDSGTHWLTLYDVANVYGWTEATIAFDADWFVIGVTGIRDNGAAGVTAGEIAAAYDALLWFSHPYVPDGII